MKKIDNRVLVLLSTYNGSRFLTELLDSVLNQSGVDVSILIRDDGSKDNTVDILKKYVDKNDNITLIEGKNIGVIGSFNSLIENPLTKKFRWMAFCDQDDIWLPDKLSSALEKLQSKSDQNSPMLYCSNTTLVDSQLNEIGMSYNKEFSFGKNTAIVRNIATGCTEVFNQAAAEKYRIGIGKFPELHDYWMYLVCSFLGTVIYDFNSRILYRQHENNTVGMLPHKSISRAIKNLFTHERGNRVKTLKGFIEAYHLDLSKEDLLLISSLANYRSSFCQRLSVFFNPKLHAVTYAETIGFKIRVLLGILY